MKDPSFIFVNGKVRSADPIAIGVDEGDIQGQKPKELIHIQNRLDRLFQFVYRGLVEDFAKVDQILPGLFVIS